MLKRQEKDGDTSKDEQKGMSDQIQKSTDSHVKEIDDLAEAKDKEIMQV
jgi:ribosome recycling factor